ncbi:MAG TPA: APC family permease [Ktedonobacterales bacterium]|nr:APC family permease [Ktedonobacterales bacterium]
MSSESFTGAVAPTKTTEKPSVGLRPNAIGVMGVLIQSVALIGPGVAVAFAFGPGITYAGGSFPLAIALAMVVALLLAVSIGQLAIHLPSAGGFYTYISRGLGRSTGFLAGWISIPAYLLFLPLNLLAFGYAGQGFSGLPWYIWAVVLAVGVGLLTFFGVRLSIRTLVVLGVIEVLVFTTLSVFLIANAGSANTFQPFTPATWPNGRGGVSGVLVGAVIGVLSFTGFESAALLAQESRNPRRIIQPVLLLAVAMMGVFFVLASYAGLVGYGFNIGTVTTPHTYLGDSPTPWFILGEQVWGKAGMYIVGLVILESLTANVAAGFTALSRVVYAMGRSGALPSAFGQVNKRYRTPTLALAITVPLTIGIALWSSAVYGEPPNSFYALVDTAAYCVLSTYVGVSLATTFYFLRKQRSDFRVLPHLVIPVAAAILLVVVLLAQVFAAIPPNNYPGLLPQYLGLIIAGGWFVIGLVWLFVLRARKPAALEAGERIYLEESGQDA